jgi:hypothetical protein
MSLSQVFITIIYNYPLIAPFYSDSGNKSLNLSHHFSSSRRYYVRIRYFWPIGQLHFRTISYCPHLSIFPGSQRTATFPHTGSLRWLHKSLLHDRSPSRVPIEEISNFTQKPSCNSNWTKFIIIRRCPSY